MENRDKKKIFDMIRWSGMGLILLSIASIRLIPVMVFGFVLLTIGLFGAIFTINEGI